MSCAVAVTAAQGMEGMLWDASTLPTMPLSSVDLARPGPVLHPLFWSALHDALLRAVPEGGSKAARSLAERISCGLGMLSLPGPAKQTGQPGGGGGGRREGVLGKGAAGGPGAGPATAQVPSRDADSEGDSDFEAAEGRARQQGQAVQGGGSSKGLSGGVEALPPAVKVRWHTRCACVHTQRAGR